MIKKYRIESHISNVFEDKNGKWIHVEEFQELLGRIQYAASCRDIGKVQRIVEHELMVD